MGTPTATPPFFSLSNDSFRGSLWAFLYSLLIVLACPAALSLGLSRYVVAALALVVLPVAVSLILWAAGLLLSPKQ